MFDRWRCQLSAAGRKALPRQAGKLGMAYNSGQWVRVVWDGQKTIQSFHPDFIEKVDASQIVDEQT